jgi:hypothetical protein
MVELVVVALIRMCGCMRKLVTMVAVATILGVSPAAGATLSLKPKPATGQMLRERAGQPAIQSELAGTTAALVVQSVTLDETGSASFLLALQNSGPQPLSLGADNLIVRAGDRKVRVYSVEDLKERARDLKLLAQSHVHAMDRAGVLGASAQVVAGYVRLPGGGYLQDPDPPQGSKKKVLAEANRRIAAADAALAEADSLGFRPVVLAPGASGWTGLTLGAVPRGATTLTITVTLGADTHRFELAIDR